MPTKTIIATIIAAGALTALIAGAFWLGTTAAPRTGPTRPPAAPNPAPTNTPAPTQDSPPDYPIINTTNRAAPITPQQLRTVRIVEQYLRVLHERDYTLPYPGYVTDQIPTISVGEARTAAQNQQPPDRQAYTQAQTDGYQKKVKVLDAYVNDTATTIVINARTTDTTTITTHVALEATMTPCTTNPAQTCDTTIKTPDGG